MFSAVNKKGNPATMAGITSGEGHVKEQKANIKIETDWIPLLAQ